MSSLKVILPLLIAFLLVGCGSDAETPQTETDQAGLPETSSAAVDNGLEMLHGWMTGSFSSQEQAEADSAFYDIRLEMVPIWPERSDALYIYVEQAVVSALDKPYRQRVYRLSPSGDTAVSSAVYTIAEPLRFAGCWRETDPLRSLTPDSLEFREGCSILLRQIDSSTFEGSTLGEGCESSLRGAAYATSGVRITAEGLFSWDRGFDSTGAQVWGAEKGGYVFKRVAVTE